MPATRSVNCCVCGKPATNPDPQSYKLASSRRDVAIWWHGDCEASVQIARFIADEFAN